MTDAERENMRRELWFSYFSERLLHAGLLTKEKKEQLEKLITHKVQREG